VNRRDTIDVVTVGESLGLLTAHETGSLRHVREMQLGFGGAESNVAIGVARLEGSAVWIGRVGADPIGELIVRELRAERVESVAIVDDEAATALMLKERPRPGASQVTYYRRFQAGSRLCPADIPRGVVERGRILHVTGITAALGESPQAAVHTAIDHAKRAGRAVSFDVNHRSSLWVDASEAVNAYRALAQRADIVFAGEDEAALVTGENDSQRQLNELLALGAKQVVIKRGALGAAAASDGGAHHQAAYQIPVVDTVGAGDAFVAGWLAEMARGADIRTCLNTASLCGALACTSLGDWEATPTRRDLAQLMRPGSDPVSR
jgi:2-dehydro-3-deoxygluconokinase